MTRLTAAVGSPELRWIWERIQARLSRGEECETSVRLQNPTAAQRTAVARLLGQLPRGESLSVDLGQLEVLLRESGLAANLAEAATAILGVDAVAERRRKLEHAADWSQVEGEAKVRTQAVGAIAAQVAEEVIASGLLRRLSGGSTVRANRLIDELIRLAARLPAPAIPLAQLAAELTGDAHCLDQGAPLGTLGQRSVRNCKSLDPFAWSIDRFDHV